MPEAAAPPPLPLLAAASSPAAAALPRARRRQQQQQRRGWRRPRRLLVWGALVAFFFIMNWWMFSRLQDPSARPHFRLRRHPPRAPATANSSLFTLEEVAGAAKGKRAHRVMLTRLLALAGHALAEAETRPEPKDLWEEPINATMWRPCSDQRDWKASEGTNGYIMISANGGINQQRVAICNAVTISRLLNATLVLPKFLYSNVWLDKSQFGDIYQEDYFIKYLKSDIQIVKDLPAELQSLDLEAIGSLVNDTDVMKEAKPSLYMKKILPILLRNRVVHFIGFGNRLSFDPIPSDLQRLRCRCNFHALRFVHKIQETGAVLVERLHGHRASSSPLKDNLLGQFAIKSDPSANKSDASKYLAVHLRFEIDMVAYSLCYFGGGKDEEDELEAYRQIHFPVLSELKKTTKLPSAAFLRSEGKCPLAPEEAVLMLAAIGFKRSTNIYIAGAEIYGGKDRMAAISRLYPALVTKETLLSPSELEPFRNFSSQLAALDFIACAAADAFAMTDPGSQFSSLVQGYRMYYGGGDLPTIRPNKRRLASILVKNATIEWNEFESRVRKLIQQTKQVHERPVARSIFRHPRSPECMCRTEH
ncbi:O-fucosyltransferase 15-like isoform X1 [Miscanthus floridulus]|uniref:O-fucosyltransferase 15-like isoform X1 n=2 Tax=Miscanthus floridulus TaxID=154761 RepID=UPI003458F769